MTAVRAAFPTSEERLVAGLRLVVSVTDRQEYWLVQTGMGLENASHIASRLLAHQPFSLVLSTGFACALVPAEIGALLLGRDVVLVDAQGVSPSDVIEVPGAERDAVLALADRSAATTHVGRFVSTERVIGTASEKARFARMTGAVGLDMESAALAIEARRAGIPFAAVRAVSDLLDENLPLDFNLFLRPTGWLKGIASVLSAPSSLVGLNRLRRQSLAAARTLTTFFQQYAAMMATDEAGTRSLTGRL
jgi:adenosylhomocysteine nucleosidase